MVVELRRTRVARMWPMPGAVLVGLAPPDVPSAGPWGGAVGLTRLVVVELRRTRVPCIRFGVPMRIAGVPTPSGLFIPRRVTDGRPQWPPLLLCS